MRTHRVAKGFTLIELLVVISIIALLLSILMPSLNKAKEASRRVVCSSNERQITLAFAAFATANKDQSVPSDTGHTGYFGGWDSEIAPYFGTNRENMVQKNLLCPADKKPRAKSQYSAFKGSQAMGRSYGANMSLANIHNPQWWDGTNYPYFSDMTNIPTKTSAIRKPYSVLYLEEYHTGFYNDCQAGLCYPLG